MSGSITASTMMATPTSTAIHLPRLLDCSAAFFAEILGLPAPRPFGMFLVVDTANGVSLDFMRASDDELVIDVSASSS